VIICRRGSEGPYVANVLLMVDDKSEETLPATLQRLRGLKRLQNLAILDPLAVRDDTLAGDTELSGFPALSWDWVSALAEALGSWPELKTLHLPTLCAMRMRKETAGAVLGWDERPEVPVDLYKQLLANLPLSLESLGLGVMTSEARLVEAFRQLRARPLPHLHSLTASRSGLKLAGMAALAVGADARRMFGELIAWHETHIPHEQPCSVHHG
jgi:hypothetical protein